MKIKILFISNNTYLSSFDTTTIPLIDFYFKKRLGVDVVFKTKAICNMLSENNPLVYWRQLYDATVEINSNSYDGIIILHETDMLVYTTSFLAFMLSTVNIPVVLVSSDLPLHNTHANGYDNFLSAVDFIINQRIKGVFIPIHKDEKTYIHLGSRLIQAWSTGYGFKSLGDVYFGIMDENGFHWNEHQYNPTIDELNCRNRLQKKDMYVKSSNIMYIKPYPGLNYDMFNLKNKPTAVFHELYNSGTACLEADIPQYTITYFAKKCINEGIDLYVAPFNTNIPNVTYKELKAAKIKLISNMSVEAAYIKLVIAYGLFDNKYDILNFLNENVFFEKIVEKKNVANP